MEKDLPLPLLSAGAIIVCYWETGAIWSFSVCRFMRSLLFRYQLESSQWNWWKSVFCSL